MGYQYLLITVKYMFIVIIKEIGLFIFFFVCLSFSFFVSARMPLIIRLLIDMVKFCEG